MVAIYIRWIKAGRMTLNDVPQKWYEEVKNKLS